MQTQRLPASDHPRRADNGHLGPLYGQRPITGNHTFHDAPSTQRPPYYKSINEHDVIRTNLGIDSHHLNSQPYPSSLTRIQVASHNTQPLVHPIPYRIVDSHTSHINMGAINSRPAAQPRALPSDHTGVYAPGPRNSASVARPEEPRNQSGLAALGARLQRIAPGQSTEQLLNPPPPPFLRPAPRHLSYPSFEPTYLIGPSERLDKGFASEIPPSRIHPHPFSTHDVREEDWMRFLSDLKKAASLTPRNRVVAGVVPMAAGIGLPGELRYGLIRADSNLTGSGLACFEGMLVSRAMENRMRGRKRGPAGELVDHWNHVRQVFHIISGAQ